jgi:hypothetical protein
VRGSRGVRSATSFFGPGLSDGKVGGA